MKKLTEILLKEEFDALNNEFVEIQDLVDNDYSRNILRILKFVRDLSDSGECHRFEIKSPNPIAKGAAGAIFDSTEKGAVIKLSSDDGDFEMARNFMNNEIPHMGKILGYKKIEVEDQPPIYLVKMEKLLPIKDIEFLSSVVEPFAEELGKENERFQRDIALKLSKKFNKKIKEFYKLNKQSLNSSQKRKLRNMLRFMKELHKNGYHFHDRQSSQFMSDRKGNLKLVDLGSIRKNAI